VTKRIGSNRKCFTPETKLMAPDRSPSIPVWNLIVPQTKRRRNDSFEPRMDTDPHGWNRGYSALPSGNP